MRWMQLALLCCAAVLTAGLDCLSGVEPSSCGPSEGVVARVLDGDTIELESGETIRYLMINTPETSPEECYGPEAKEFNTQLVEGKTVSIVYDQVCTDAYDRLLAYVTVEEREVNMLMVERGYACVLVIPPNGEDRELEFLTAEAEAEAADTGMWGICDPVACEE